MARSTAPKADLPNAGPPHVVGSLIIKLALYGRRQWFGAEFRFEGNSAPQLPPVSNGHALSLQLILGIPLVFFLETLHCRVTRPPTAAVQKKTEAGLLRDVARDSARARGGRLPVPDTAFRGRK